jgi:hypothetical protein
MTFTASPHEGLEQFCRDLPGLDALQAGRKKQGQQQQQQPDTQARTGQPTHPAHRLTDGQPRALPLTPAEAYDANLVCPLLIVVARMLQ